MASSGNFATIGGLEKQTNFTFSQGNLKYSTNTNNNGFICSSAIPITGKYYFECYVLSVGAGTSNVDDIFVGVCNPNIMRSNLTGNRGGGLVNSAGQYVVRFYDGSAYLNSNSGESADALGYKRNYPQIVGFAIDRDNNNFKWTWDGSSYSSTYSIPATEPLYVYVGSGGGTQTSAGIFNFGQDSTFGGLLSAGGNADGNSIGDFSLAVPSGYLALSSNNIPISDDIDPAQTDDDYPAKQFGVVTYTGNGSSNAVSGLGLQPDLVWAKMRSSTQANILIDSSRGQGLLFSSQDNAEQTSNGPFMTSYDSDGFTLASSGSNPNDSGQTYVAWCWRANGGTTSSNSSGDITSTVQANTKAGFSIVKYTGNGSSAQSIGHGLSSGAPEFIIVKNRDAADSWAVYHHSLGNSTHAILDTNAAPTTSSAYWGSFTPTTTLFKVGSDHKLNASGEDYVAYLWHGVEGYSKFGSYEGNGDNDGPFIYMGFRPRLVCIKAVDSNQAWYVTDTERETFNPLGEKMLSWNDSHAEFDPSGFNFDVVSNGIKIRSSDTNINSSATFIYMAWGDVPFKYNNTF